MKNCFVIKFKLLQIITIAVLFILIELPVKAQGYEAQDSTRVMELYSDAYNALQSGELTRSKALIREADSLSTVHEFRYGNVFSNVRMAQLYNMEQKYDSVLYIVEFALNAYPERHSKITTDLFNELGRAQVNMGRLQEALNSYQIAQEEILQLDSLKYADYAAGLNMNIADVYINMGDYPEGARRYLQVIDYAQANNDSSLLTLSSINLGGIYSDQSEAEKASYYLERAIEIAQKTNNRHHLYLSYINLANVRVLQEEYEGAESLYMQAYDLHQRFSPDSPAIYITSNLGWLNTEMGNYMEAERYYQQSLQDARAINFREGMYENYAGLGDLFEQQQRYEEAIEQYEAANQTAQQMENAFLLAASRLYMYEAYKGAQNYELALENLELHKEIDDSLKNVEQEEELAEVESQIELRRQNQINTLLQEKQTQQEARIKFQTILIAAGAMILLLIGVLLYITRKNAREKEQLLKEIEVQRDELAERNKAKDQVFAVVSHDLRSPLTSVQGVIELIRDDVLKGDQLRDLLDGIEASVRENVNVIEDLLAWAKDQLSGFELHPKPLELKPLLSDVMTTQSFLAIQKKIEMRDNLNGYAPTVFADPNAIRVIFRNLISNAIKYTKEGGTIEVDAKETSDSIVISVKDNGVGIPESSIEKVFNSNTWTRAGTGKEKGSGFGLSMTKEFVEKMNGRIWFESDEGKGTTFFVELPKPA